MKKMKKITKGTIQEIVDMADMADMADKKISRDFFYGIRKMSLEDALVETIGTKQGYTRVFSLEAILANLESLNQTRKPSHANSAYFIERNVFVMGVIKSLIAKKQLG